jgi:hypothetical protein
VEKEIHKEVQRLRRDGPTRAEWADARAIIARGARLAYEGSTRAGFRLGFFGINGDLAREGTLLRKLLRVSRADARAEAERLFPEESSVTVRYVPSGGASGE